MKWVYVPIMFALSFLYTKTIFNLNVNQATSPKRVSRGPASIGAEVNSVVIKRVAAQNFYHHLNTDALTPFTLVNSFRGPILGNVQVESFGYVLDDSKKATLGITDYNEVTEGALFHDVLSHLVSVKALDKKVAWMNYFEFYKSGLLGEAHTNSFYIEKGQEEAISHSEKILDEAMTADFPIEFKVMRNTHRHVAVLRKSQIQNELKKIYPKIQFFDLYQKNANEEYFEALVRLKPTDKIQWLSIIENTHTHYDKAFSKENVLGFEARFALIKHKIYSDKLNQSLKSFKIGVREYSVRFKEQFGVGINWSEIPVDDYHDCLMDQAYLLGKIHRSSLDSNVDDYIKAWAKIPAALIDEKAVELKFKLKDQDQ